MSLARGGNQKQRYGATWGDPHFHIIGKSSQQPDFCFDYDGNGKNITLIEDEDQKFKVSFKFKFKIIINIYMDLNF